VTRAELDHIHSDPEEPETPVRWAQLLAHRETWALLIARFLTDPVWWFYLYWAPKFLFTRHGLTLDRIAVPLVVIYLFADFGSIFGGWLSSFLLRRGYSVNAARKLAILACALMVAPVAFASYVDSMWLSVILIGFAAAGHQGWAANMFAMISDIYPKNAVSSATGLAGFGGSAGGMLASTAVGLILQYTGSYLPALVWAGCSYLVILAIIHVMIPRIGPARAA
jgi:ACS family hexuronate transporter-like MFS transporter